MPTSIETEETNMETNQNGMDMGIRNRSRVVREGSNFLKRDREGGNIGDGEEGGPKDWTDTGMPNIVSLMPTGEGTAFILGTKPRPSTPVIGDRTNMCKGEGKRFARAKNICLDDAGDSTLGDRHTKDSMGFKRDKGTKAKRGPLLFEERLIYLFLREG